MREKYWESNTLNDLFRLCVGKTYGENPLEQIDVIRQNKCHEASNLDTLLHFQESDIVADLGSGCGFIARGVAPRVKKLYCLDIDSNFLNYCKNETSDFNNVECQLIEYANLSILKNKDVNKIYSTSLFIHFNLYDIYHYLTACYDCLAPGGYLLFDFLPSGTLDIDDDIFKRHALRYLNNSNKLFTNVYWNDLTTIERIYTQVGFGLVQEKYDNTHQFLVLQKQ